MTAITPDPCSDDPIAKGAYTYWQYTRDALALANTYGTALELTDIVQF